MRIPVAISSFALIVLHGTVTAEPLRACAQVGALVDRAVHPLLAELNTPNADLSRLQAQLSACLSSHNICSVQNDARDGKRELAAADVTTDLPEQYLAENGKSYLIFLARSIPRVRNDSNRYCLVSERHSGDAAARQWDVYGWVIAPGSGDPLPLKRELLNYKPGSEPKSVRAVAAALWFFAERMSGRAPKPQEESSKEASGP